MPQRSRPMTDRDIAAIVDDQIHDSILYNRTELAQLRRKALLYYEGDETLAGDVPLQEKRSRVVSRDLSDVHGWIMPSLLRVFLSSDRVVVYEPRRQNAEEAAKQATDYVNYIFLSECDGYAVLHSAFWDGLCFGNGIVKHWWDDTPEYSVESLSGLPEAEFIRIVSDPEVEKVLEHTAYDDPDHADMADSGGMDGPLAPAAGGTAAVAGAPAGAKAGADSAGAPGAAGGVPATGAGALAGYAGTAAPAALGPALGVGTLSGPNDAPAQLHDVKIKRKLSSGRARVAAVPPEQFRLDRNATMLDERHCRFAAHVELVPRSQLVEDGYDPDIVDDLPAHTALLLETPESMIREERQGTSDNAPDRSTELIEVWECYIQLDYDGDGIAEWRRIVTAAEGSNRAILLNEEWGDDLPFSDVVPAPMPHRWRGQSLYEDLADIQRIKTVMWRGINDNLYWHNNPQREVVDNAVSAEGMDELLSPTFNGVVPTRAIGSVMPMPIPFVADKLISGIELADQIREFRTGVSAATMALDPEALANQTATAVNASQTASYSKTETYARNIAEYRGMKRIFGCLLKLIVKHQDEARTIKLRGEWVTMDPRGWDADMDVVVNVGLGSGSRDRDLATLQAVAAKQELVTQGLGPVIAAKLGLGPDKVFATYRKMVEAAGLKSPESYFPEITADQVNQLVQQMGQEQGQNPAMAESQAKIQLMQQESQAKLQAQQQQMAAEQQAKQQQAALDWQHKQSQAEIDNQHRATEIQARGQAQLQEIQMKHQLAIEDAQRGFALKQQEIQSNAALKERELQIEAALKRQQMMMQPQTAPLVREPQ